MNPPFKHSAQFIERAIELGANKICVFEKASFLGSVSRQGFWNNAPLTHILYCAQRANCKRFDLVEKSLNSTTHDHAWFIFESNAKHKSKHPTVERIYK